MAVPAPTALPVDEILPQIVASLERRPNLVLEAPPGAGKTTRVPPALLSAGDGTGGRVLVLEPRRVAARAAARRIAAERGWSVGREVGWQIRFERNFTRDTALLFVTEGILIQKLQHDPFLEGISTVVFDEIHERSLFADLSLALARGVQRDARPDLRLVAMSATLEPGPLADFLDAPVVRSEGRIFPVAIHYLPRPEPETPLATLVALGVRRGLDETAGDLLVFLPGAAEIRRAQEALAGLAGERELEIAPLYGDLPATEQDRLLAPGTRRRVVLATNVAETSITLEGVTGVVDSGWVRELSADAASGLERLETVRISRASADQRSGRAGRLAPGWCLRLWSEHEQRSFQERTRPEIRRADLAWSALQLHAWGERDPADFPWFEAPDAPALAQAEATLRRLEALDASGAITPLGRRLAALPLHPRLGRLAVAGETVGVGPEAALVAALLSDRDPLRAIFRTRGARTSGSDLLDALDELDELRHPARRGPASSLFRARDQIVATMRASNTDPPPGSPASPTTSDDDRDSRLRRAISRRASAMRWLS